MNLFFLSPWSALDPLTRTTVIAHMMILNRHFHIDKIDFFTIEKDVINPITSESGSLLPKGFVHYPIIASVSSIFPLDRLLHLRHMRKILLRVARLRRPKLILCRGTTGIFGDMLKRRLGIPYAVESFEPHAHYMLQTGTWQRWDPKYLVQRRWEEQVKRNASALITVSHGYAQHLREREGISLSRLRTVPCWVDSDRFRLDPQARFLLRQQLGIGDRLAVVYAGKFGGIYSPLHDLAILRDLQQGLGQPIYLMLLTSADPDAVNQQINDAGFSADQVFVQRVPYDHVNAYLNAADLAVSFINSGPWSFACSAIKHGEYWACGLPVLMPPGVGDEAGWLENEQAGAIAPFSDPAAVRAAAIRLRVILDEPDHRERIRAIGLRERGAASLLTTYSWLLERFEIDSGAAV
jgi:glycosyltransferase involved in cell wall biosynthesis